MRIRIMMIAVLGALVAFSTGCRSTFNVGGVDRSELETEGNIVFVRPTEYWLFFGTKSLRDYVRVAQEKAVRNEGGLLEVTIGIRNVGGQHIWDLKGKDFPISIKTAFYDKQYQGEKTVTPIYETNWQTMKLLRGSTTEYKVICPKKEGAYYQVTMSELIK